MGRVIEFIDVEIIRIHVNGIIHSLELAQHHIKTQYQHGIESEQLLEELGIWRSTITPYSNLFDKDLFLKDLLAFKMDMVEGFIKEFHSWEVTGNEIKCKNAIDNAEFFLGQIQGLFDSMFAEQHQGTGQDTKKVSSGMSDGKERDYQSA